MADKPIEDRCKKAGDGDDATDSALKATNTSEMAQKEAFRQHRREIKGGWSLRPEILNS